MRSIESQLLVSVFRFESVAGFEFSKARGEVSGQHRGSEQQVPGIQIAGEEASAPPTLIVRSRVLMRVVIQSKPIAAVDMN